MFWKATDRVSLLNYRWSESDLKRLSYEEITKSKSLLSLGVGGRARARAAEHFRDHSRRRPAHALVVIAGLPGARDGRRAHSAAALLNHAHRQTHRDARRTGPAPATILEGPRFKKSRWGFHRVVGDESRGFV